MLQPYSNDPKDIKNNFIHLTNYSVNKNSGEFIYNEAPGRAGGRVAGSRWQVAAGGRWQVSGVRWQVVGGRWQVAGDRRQVAGGRVAGSRWQVAGGRVAGGR